MGTFEPESAHRGTSQLPSRTADSFDSWFKESVVCFAEVRAAMRSRMAPLTSSLCALDAVGHSDTQWTLFIPESHRGVVGKLLFYWELP